MVKGINKQMIVLRIDGNRIYESACFILKNEVSQSKGMRKDMLQEANRLLGEMDLKGVRPKKRSFFKRLMLWLTVFLLGALLGFGLSFFL